MLMGPDAAKLMRDAFKNQCLPPKVTEVSKAVEAAQRLMASAAFKWSAGALKGELQSAVEMLKRLEKNEPIAVGTCRTEWLDSILIAMEGFLTKNLETEAEGDAVDEDNGILLHQLSRLRLRNHLQLLSNDALHRARHKFGPELR